MFFMLRLQQSNQAKSREHYSEQGRVTNSVTQGIMPSISVVELLYLRLPLTFAWTGVLARHSRMIVWKTKAFVFLLNNWSYICVYWVLVQRLSEVNLIWAQNWPNALVKASGTEGISSLYLKRHLALSHPTRYQPSSGYIRWLIKQVSPSA